MSRKIGRVEEEETAQDVCVFFVVVIFFSLSLSFSLGPLSDGYRHSGLSWIITQSLVCFERKRERERERDLREWMRSGCFHSFQLLFWLIQPAAAAAAENWGRIAPTSSTKRFVSPRILLLLLLLLQSISSQSEMEEREERHCVSLNKFIRAFLPSLPPPLL